MSLNFEFLTQEPLFKSFASACVDAEKSLAASPGIAALSTRRVLEYAVCWFFAVESKTFGFTSQKDGLSSLIHHYKFRQELDKTAPKLQKKLHYVVKLGNLAAHSPNENVSRDEAVLALSHLFEFVAQLDYRYGSAYTPRTFDANALPGGEARPVGASLPERVKAQIQKLADDRERDAATIAKLREELAARLDELTALKESREKSVPFVFESNWNEAETRRRYIDVELKLRGWDFASDGNVSQEFEIQGLASGGAGRADYVLWGKDGKPLAVVEAKRTSVDPQAGQEQAKQYADALEKRFGRRPLIFYSNGCEHWFWNDAAEPPRNVGGFFTRDDLERIVARRGAIQPFATLEVPARFAARSYQLQAVRAVAEGVELGRRRFLLAMATGTGKTRTVAALVDLLTRSGRVRDVLFLADRVELVRQAKDAFAKTTNANLCNLLENDDPTTAQIVFSTYPTIMNRVDEANTKRDGKTFSPGRFDLIVVDEAHRSVYQKYKAIFNYFDATLVGLTATPKDEVDRDTFKFFEVGKNAPTFAYSYEEAKKDGWLVEHKTIEIQTNLLKNGIVYDELSPEEKTRYEELFGSGETVGDDENGSVPFNGPDKIDAAAINEYVFNAPTVDAMLQELWSSGIKTAGGYKLGKTIIFAPNKRAAGFVVERFDALYPQYRGEFARRIVCGDSGNDALIAKFKRADSEPNIAVTVDMLETGIDVPECVNLVFFKRIRSKTKFWQALGRGTRHCDSLRCADGLDGEYVGKRRFFVFDYMQNFEFFRQNKDGVKSGVVKSLNERIFERKVRLIAALQDAAFCDDEDCRAWREKMVGETVAQVAAINVELMAARNYRASIDKFRDASSFAALSETDTKELTQHIAPLAFIDDADEWAKRFDAFLYGAALAAIFGENLDRSRAYLTGICDALETKTTIPQVKERLTTIQFAKSDEFWNGVAASPITLENVRRELRDLCQFLSDEKGGAAVYSTFDDATISRKENARFDVPSINLDEYRRKVERYIEEHKDEPAIDKLRNNIPLTKSEWADLQRILESLGSADSLRSALAGRTLGIFVRQIATIERATVEKRSKNLSISGA